MPRRVCFKLDAKTIANPLRCIPSTIPRRSLFGLCRLIIPIYPPRLELRARLCRLEGPSPLAPRDTCRAPPQFRDAKFVQQAPRRRDLSIAFCPRGQEIIQSLVRCRRSTPVGGVQTDQELAQPVCAAQRERRRANSLGESAQHSVDCP
jgi:hypothetical protein